ncbi:DUF1127 domain-containing protein [Amaricoccus sp.]|uniref:DUF1127 domain-containing protein n=1 Tax=Amaricoccus sp. TaxID=1872485 RepID=UPI002639A46C|nr:DUF1127 domain-containing protein [Amaricoccus sp.]HRO12237.1 DUF1127 domain-containing protein [Amaricoccus sp.]
MYASEVSPAAAPLGSVTTLRVVQLAQRALDAVAAWHKARVTRRELLLLSDQQLADIGLVRGAIAEVADSLARR